VIVPNSLTDLYMIFLKSLLLNFTCSVCAKVTLKVGYIEA